MSKKINDLTLGTIGTTMQLETDIAGTTANKINISQLDARYKTDFLLYKGAISVAADFPTPAAVLTGYLYSIAANVTDDDVTKTNTGLSFKTPTSIYWNGATWKEAGSLSKALTDGKIWIGDATNMASQVTMSGEATITNLGVMTLSNAAVIGKVLTGFSSGAGVVAATDTILQAIGKLDGNTIALDGAVIKRNGLVGLTDNWDAGSYEIRALTFQSDVATGSAPFTVASTTVVANLNASAVNGYSLNQALQTGSSPSFTGLTVSGLTTANGIVITSGAGVLSSSTALPNGTTATTQTAGDNTTKVATTAFVTAAIPSTYWSRVAGTPSYLIPITGTDTIGNAVARIAYGYFTGIDTGIAVIDNLSVDGNTISSTSGHINLIPFAGSQVVIDSNFSFDSNALSAALDANLIFNAYTGKNITIESVTFDGGVVGGITTLSMSSTLTNSSLNVANGIVQTNGSGVFSTSVTLPNGTLATTQTQGDNSTKVATTAYVDAAVSPENTWNRVVGTPNYLLPATAADDIGATGARITKGWFTAIDSGLLNVDNLQFDLNTISSTAGALNLTPFAGSAVVLDSFWSVDGNTITFLSPSGSCYINAQTGYGVWVEGVAFDGGLTSTTSLWITGQGVAGGILTTSAGGVVTSSVTLPDGTLATTQSQSDNTTKLATTAYVRTAISAIPAVFWVRVTGGTNYIVPTTGADHFGFSSDRITKIWSSDINSSYLSVDNLIVDGNTISSSTGAINITPFASYATVIDSHFSFDGTTLTAITDAHTSFVAYAGKNITIEGVGFDGSLIGGVISVSALNSNGITLYDDGGNVGLKVNDGGNITKPTTCKFSAYVNSDVATATGDSTVYTVAAGIELYDIGGNYNNGTYTFYAPLSGYYKLGGSVRATEGTAHAINYLAIVVTGTSARTYYLDERNSAYVYVPIGTYAGERLIYMTGGDAATLTFMCSSGYGNLKDVTVKATDTMFYGELVG